MWARHPGQQWVHWGNYELTPGTESQSVTGELPPQESLRSGFWKVVRRVLPAVAALLCAGALLGAAPGAQAAGNDAERGAGDVYVSAALADPAVKEALDGVTYQSTVAEWGGTGGSAGRRHSHLHLGRRRGARRRRACGPCWSRAAARRRRTRRPSSASA